MILNLPRPEVVNTSALEPGPQGNKLSPSSTLGEERGPEAKKAGRK